MKRKKAVYIVFTGMTILFLILIPVFLAAKAIDVVPDGLAKGTQYELSDFFENPYKYDEDWTVYIDSIGSPGGKMSLFRPVDPALSNKSRAFAHESTVYAWGSAMGGNPKYVRDTMVNNIKFEKEIKEITTGKKFLRYYVRDIAALAGASDVEVHDMPLDGNTGYIVIKTTPFPKGSITAPKEVTAGKSFTVKISGEEFEPSSQNKISYSISAENTALASGVKYVSLFTGLEIPITLNTTGKRTLNLKITDRVERSTTVSVIVNVTGFSTGEPEPELPPEEPEEPTGPPNNPPIADVFVEPSYYWVEEVPFKDNSKDIDGEIVYRELSLDGAPTENPKKFSRITSPEDHTVSLRVLDDQGAEGTDSATFKLLPTTPTAEFSIGGALKENRRIILDGTLSDKKSPIHVAPIDYSKTNWTIKPLTEGVLPSDILIRTSNDHSKKDFLVRKYGEYEVTLTVTNVFGETSEPVTKKITIEPDKPPVANITVDTGKSIRDKNNNKLATIKITDNSFSEDDDPIKQRIYYMDFDSNNDGYYGTELDEPKKVLSNGNDTSFFFTTSKVGNYRFSMEVVENYGQETLEEFIQDEHYRRDSTGVIDSTGKVETYQDPVNFNLGLYDTSVEVINVSPVIDFGVRRQNSIDIVMNFGGMDVATQQHLTGPAPGGGDYDHIYYAIDESAKNRLTALASTLESSLLAKGIDAQVTIDNSYHKQPDADGIGIRNVPQYGWVDYGSYSYDYYSGTSPYYGSWEVTSSGSYFVETWCYSSYWTWSDKLKKMVLIEHSHAPPCSDSSNASGYYQYWANLRQWYSNWQYVIVSYGNQGLNSTEQVNTTDFTDAYFSQMYRPNAQRIYLRMDERPWDWMGNISKVNLMINKSSTDLVYFWNMANALNRFNAETIINGSLGRGQFANYDSRYLTKNIKDVENYIINKYFVEEDGMSTTIVLGDKLDYTTNYTDHENDPEIKREWKFTHDHTQINGRTIDNAPESPVPQSGLYIDSPLQLTEVGTYKVQLRAQDDPIYDGDERFFNYRKWSDEEVQREYIINVHRRPVADFTFDLNPTALELTLDPTVSYDPDHQFNRSDKGIVEHTWIDYTVDGVTHEGAPPTTLEANKNYDVTLQVKDIDGAYGVVTKRISTEAVNTKPDALFDAPDVVANTQDLHIIDRSYDPNGDELTDYQVTIRHQSNSTIIRTLDTFPNNFEELGLGTGNFMIGLTVKDLPKVGTQLTSDLYERTIKVIENRPPVSKFTLSPNPLLVNEVNTYTDQSSDPDGHPLKNYSWTIEKLDTANQAIDTWNTGVVPTDWREYGTGRFRVTQTVFDDPPYPLQSLSGSSSVIVDVVLGPQRPFALFDYLPNPATQGDTIKLDPDRSFDPDGTVTAWEWNIKDPTNTITTSTTHYPQITNAQIGTYEVTLHVRDNDNLRSRVPMVQTIKVNPKPPNIPPVAVFIWDPFKPTLGEMINFNGDASYDVDGEIASRRWTFVDTDYLTQTSTNQYPQIRAANKRYAVTLEVTDDRGAIGKTTQYVDVNIAWLIGKVNHTPEWSQRWVDQGYASDVNTFYAGEKFILDLTSAPANKVWGKVHFGGSVGLVDIPSSSFTLVSTSPYEYKWRAELWRDDFINIEEGQYMFEFLGLHPVNNPTVQSTASYLIQIQSNVYEAMRFHRKY